MELTGAQIRAARGLLNWSVTLLSEQTGLAINTLRRAEAENGVPAITAANAELIRATLETAGVAFIAADALGPGVRLKELKPRDRQPRRRDVRS